MRSSKEQDKERVWRESARESERGRGVGGGGWGRREGQFLLAVNSTNPSNKVARGINGAAVR